VKKIILPLLLIWLNIAVIAQTTLQFPKVNAKLLEREVTVFSHPDSSITLFSTNKTSTHFETKLTYGVKKFRSIEVKGRNSLPISILNADNDTLAKISTTSKKRYSIAIANGLFYRAKRDGKRTEYYADDDLAFVIYNSKENGNNYFNIELHDVAPDELAPIILASVCAREYIKKVQNRSILFIIGTAAAVGTGIRMSNSNSGPPGYN
jgi:hypothetical protein